MYAAADAGEITEEEAGLLVRSMLSAGVDTTVTALGAAIWCLANNPDQFSTLRSDPKLARWTFEETLRHASPVHSFCRTANVYTEVGEVRIVEGTKVLCVLGLANHDESHWKEPENSTSGAGRRTTWPLALASMVASVRSWRGPRERRC